MTHRRLPTALIGFGKMASGYASDPLMARYYPYSTHAQVLAQHEAFEWRAVVDPNPQARTSARSGWSVPCVAATVSGLGEVASGIEVAVLATPPDTRLSLLDSLPNVKAILVEKPLGVDASGSRSFLGACHARGILVQVNIWRRADETFRALAAGGLHERIGQPQAASILYGNGLLNNGTHMVDFARMLFGEVESVQCVGAAAAQVEGPLPGDANPAFALNFSSGLCANFLPLRFADYRENGLLVWGRRGRLDILNEGLTLAHYPLRPNRAMSGEREIAADCPQVIPSTVGVALRHMYTNLAQTLAGTAALHSSGASAWATSQVVEAVRQAPLSGERVALTRGGLNAP